MRAKEFILEAVDVGFITNYIKKHHDENLHPDYLDNLNKFSKFILKNIPVNSLKLELSGLDRAKVEQYKKMNFDTAPPIVVGDGYVLDGYHRATAAKELGIPTIKAYVGTKAIAEGTYDSETFNIKRRPLNVSLLIQKGAIFVTHPHSEQGWETGANIPDWQFSLITLHNLYHLPWCADAKKYLKPEAYNQASKQIHSVSDGKYNQILWSIQKLGIPEEQAFLDKT
jgi:hypothetical protein